MKNFTLNNGVMIPSIAFGTYLITDARVCEKSVIEAIKCGYRHIDTANSYFNEKAVGRAIKKCGVPREQIFITSKLWPTMYETEKCRQAIEETLQRLDTPYIDLLLLHQPYGEYVQAYKVMEEYVKAGKIKAIGLSNFNQKKVQEILDACEIVPAVDQVECNPYFQQKELEAFLSKHKILIESWYPIGHGDRKLISEPLFTELGKKYGKTNVQIILRWHIQSGKITLPKSINPEHIRENFDIFDFEFTKDEMQQLSSFDKNQPYFIVADEDVNGFCSWNVDFNNQV